MILTPHIGGSTEEAQADIGRSSPTSCVRLRRRGQHHAEREPAAGRASRAARNRIGWRICTATRPGVLAAVNGILADHRVNIEGQVLSTRGTLGYLLTDIACDYPPDVMDALAAMPETTRLRVLS